MPNRPWYESDKVRSEKEVRCEPCKKGFHAERGCIGRACQCFCLRTESVAPQPKAVPFTYRADLPNVLKKMREHGIEVRGTRTWKLVYRPKPADMEPWLRMAIKNHENELVHILFPYTQRKPTVRDFWTSGPIDVCFDCKESCAHYDPLGHCRHSWCGWLSIAIPA